MKKLVLVLAALVLLCSCAVAEPASVVETGAGIKVIPASEWEATYPDIYASYVKNQENSAIIDHVEEYPQIAVIYEGMAFNKFYGSAEGSLWAGKRVAILATHGYDRAYATDPFAMGVERLCKHSGLIYCGLYSVQDEDDLASFQAEAAVEGAKEFARKLIEETK